MDILSFLFKNNNKFSKCPEHILDAHKKSALRESRSQLSLSLFLSNVRKEKLGVSMPKRFFGKQS